MARVSSASACRVPRARGPAPAIELRDRSGRVLTLAVKVIVLPEAASGSGILHPAGKPLSNVIFPKV
jgi:hypothetical protein